MSKIVFVLGAGASEHCGTPLMGNFLEVAEDLMRLGEIEVVREDFKDVFDAIGNLHAIQSKANINTYNIEDVYAAFEMGKLLGRLPGIEEKSKLEKLTSSIKKVIGYTLQQTTKLHHNPQGEILEPGLYNSLINILHRVALQKKSLSIITFNYDLGFDYSLYKRQILTDYGLDDIDVTNKRYITYLKLHGSLNWGKCRKCGRITPYRQFKITENKAGKNYSIIPIISELQKHRCSFCGESVGEDPFIVPPTWNKTTFHEQIDQVWRRAALELKDAENIFVLGYSLPSTDLFFHYLFALGVDMKTILRGFYVFNPDSDVEKRFRNLLGSGIEQRFHFYNYSFASSLRAGLELTDPPDFKTIPMILDIK